MRLKQIKLAGFKSFVDPTTVSFPGNRCAIVGPNGCGKSNIIDAVRWVMGESSARQLRGESITDVIFSGSSTRKPTAMAAIELVFDNADGRIGGEYSGYAEIAIRREVSRDSQSTYFLNGDKCRRRDIMDIFLGTGFGPRSYSIIEQGMISQLVEAKPDELRVYLEEAAGISKYKERRRETENRIRHTEENLARLTDIRDELERQLNHLKRQANAAERYRELKEEERKLTAELYTLRLNAVEAELAERETAIRSMEVRLERAIAEQRSVDAEIEKSRAHHAEQSEEFNRVQGRYYQLGADIARIEEAIAYNQQRVKQLELDLDTVAQRRTETERQLELDDREIKSVRSKIADVAPRREAAAAADLASNEALEAAEAKLKEWQTAWDTFGDRAAANQRDCDVQASRIEHLEQLLQRLKRRQAQLDDEFAGVAVGDVEGDLGDLAAEIDQVTAELARTELELDHSLKALAAAREDLIIREQVLDAARNDVARLRHELASLEAVQNAALGRAADAAQERAQAWLASAGLAAAPRLGESITVAGGWERAVETVLGDRLKAVHVDDLESFAKSLAGLQQGVVTLLAGGAAGETRGTLPALASFVRATRPVGTLLDGVFAAQSLDVALSERAGLDPAESIITRDGLWIGRDWVKLDRGDDVAHGVLERGHQIEALRERVEQAETHLAELHGRLGEGRARIDALDDERQSMSSRINVLGQRLGQLRADHGVHQVRQEEADARKARVQRERAEMESQIAQENEHLVEARQRLAAAVGVREQMQQQRAALSSAREQNLRALDELRQRARADRDAFHALNVEQQNLKSALAATETAQARLLKQAQELESRRATIASGIEQSREPLPNLNRDLDTKLADRLAVERKLGDVRQNLEEADERLRGLESTRVEKAEAVEAVRSELEAARVERQGQHVKRSNLLEQIGTTGIAVEIIRERLPVDATEFAWMESLERIGNRINRLGAINLAAIEEFKAAAERKEYLDSQHQDLTEALTTLTNAIRKIDRETRIRFKETFEAVNARLGELFPKVFGGGHAYLELTGEDLLDTGVTLMARPPGKRNTSIHLLSGGEKAMTAVALIFAIFQLNPSPVCLLDEVDAPLDDSNVVRFANLIRDMAEDVQFVVITHNKLTMEMADQLMGVTMQEPGVSRLVSVDVEEAAQMAAV